MNNEKIGNLIKKSRKEKNLTQSELAKILNVSDKAISKWERGLCCPDISLLIPISETLNIELYELLTGEKESQKTDENALKNVIMISNNELKNKNSKFKRKNLIISFICIITILLISIKLINLYKYMIPYELSESYISDKGKIISTLTLNDNEYFKYKNIKFKNIFKDFVHLDNINPTDTYEAFALYDKNKKIVAYFTISANNSYFFQLKNNILPSHLDQMKFKNFNQAKFLKENNINNDWDLINFLIKNKNIKNNFFTSNKTLKENYYISELIDAIIGYENKFEKIEGNIKGYIKYFEDMEFTEIHILYNEVDYTLVLSNFFDNDLVEEILKSIKIEK